MNQKSYSRIKYDRNKHLSNIRNNNNISTKVKSESYI